MILNTIIGLAIFVLILWIGTMIVFAMAVGEIRKELEKNTAAKTSLIKMQLNSQYGKTGIFDVNSLYPRINEDEE